MKPEQSTNKISIAVLLAVLISALILWRIMIWMPLQSYKEPIPAFTEEELRLAEFLHRDVGHLAGKIGERNVYTYGALLHARDYIEQRLRSLEAGTVSLHTYLIEGKEFSNIEMELSGNRLKNEIIIIGAHYDTHSGTPGANDNGSGVAAMLALAEKFSGSNPDRTLRFVAFVNEELPFFSGPYMGSRVYAERSKQRNENISAMLSLETMGYFSDQPRSQSYPFPINFFYPNSGNFIAFVSNINSAALLRKTIRTFRLHTPLPSEGAALPESIPGVSWSDHSSFWKHGYRAIMVTDTAPFRYPYYHHLRDTPDKLDYNRLARIVFGLEKVVRALSDKETDL